MYRVAYFEMSQAELYLLLRTLDPFSQAIGLISVKESWELGHLRIIILIDDFLKRIPIETLALNPITEPSPWLDILIRRPIIYLDVQSGIIHVMLTTSLLIHFILPCFRYFGWWH